MIFRAIETLAIGWLTSENYKNSFMGPGGSDGLDKPFCTKAIPIIDNFKKNLGDTVNR